MITRCASCRKDAITHDMVWSEPLSDEDSTVMFYRGWICHACEVAYCAWEFDEEWEPSDIGGTRREIEVGCGEETFQRARRLNGFDTWSRSSLEYVEEMIQQLPSGVDEDARDDDPSPEDMTAHLGGLILRRVRDALGKREG